ncbi:MAG: extracellular solute-binding protein [Thermodesulfobacteriota bacterium]
MSDALRTCLLACGLVVLAAGCDADDDGAATVVDFWALGREGEVVERLVPAFEERTPGVRVRVQQIPWSAAREKLITALVAGTMPDVFQLGSTWVAEFLALGAIEPLAAPRFPAPAGGDDFFAGILEANVIDGTTWGLPWYVDTRVLFYRSDLLSRTGCRAPRTWDEWLGCMEAVRREASGDAFAILLPLTEWETPVILAMQSGATLLRDDDQRGNFQSAEFRRAFTLYLSLFERGLAPRGGEATAANVYQGFAEGTFSFLVTGPWNLSQFRERLPASLARAWATAPMPAPDGRWPGVSLAGGASLALWRGSKVKDAAWRWMQYLVEPAQQAELNRLAGDLPARASAWRELALDRGEHTSAFWLQLQHVRPTPRIPEWERIAAEIGRRAEAAIRGVETVDQALAALDENVDRILAKRRWLRARAARERAGDAP